MSIDCMSAVMNRYPGRSGEYAVALALADNASKDGQSIFPSVDDLARRSRLEPRSVQRHINTMIAAGWLELVRATSGRPGDTNHYRISARWLAGGDCVPPKELPRREPVKRTGDILSPVTPVDKPVDNPVDEKPRQVTPECETGDTGVTQPVSNRQNTNTTPTPLHDQICGQLGHPTARSPTAEPPNSRLSGEYLDNPAPDRVHATRWPGSRVGIRAPLPGEVPLSFDEFMPRRLIEREAECGP